MPVFTAFVVFVAFSLVTGARHHEFLQPSVFWNILRDNAFLGIIAVGEAFVILSGGIDLSVGAVLGFTSVAMAALIGAHVHPLLAMLICLSAGAAFGGAMGKIISFFDVPPFLVTLAGLFFARGIAYVVSTESSVISHPLYDRLADTTWLAPALFGVVLLVGHYLLHFRPFGRSVYAVGGNEQSAVLMGVRADRTKTALYALSGFCAALGGIVYTFYTVSGDSSAGVTLELDAITAVVIGGTLLTGGYGSLVGTAIGVMLLGAVQSAITYENNISSWWTRIIVGGLLLMFLLIQKGVEKGVLNLFANRGRAEAKG
jgi:simple sugar transport system permease protein